MARLVICDDENRITDILARFFREKGHEVSGTTRGEEALELVLAGGVDLLVTDIAMQGLSGLDLLKRVKAAGELTPVIITTGNPSHGSAVQALREGAYDYVVKPFHLEEILERAERALMDKRIREENVQYSKLVSLHSISKALSEAGSPQALAEKAISRGERAVLVSWAGLVGRLVEEHCLGYESKVGRVSELGRSLMDELGWAGEAGQDWDILAQVYDLSKLRVPQRILEKKKPLTDKEKEFIRGQASWARDCLAGVPGLDRAAQAVEDFHERFDGKGRPHGKPGESIAPLARLLSVADAFVALCSGRPYRGAFPEAQALDLIRAESGTRFDPRIVQALARIR
jgi:putative two-component system response regulator